MNLSRTSNRPVTLALIASKKRWLVRSCKGNALAGALAGLMLVASAIGASEQAPLAMRHGPLHGTLTKIDAPALRLQMQSDTGRRIDLAVANVDAMRRVRVGDQVRVDVDENGVVLNIAKAIVAPRPSSYSRG